ncbi:MAG: hypothetical protein M3434_11565 [Gemmatimonadota bacterium]|nr:hypothetical protein [Gemmatimonadota bacterium]
MAQRGILSRLVTVRTPTLEQAIDDYLHVVVRTRPWTRKREAEALTAFVAWFRGPPTSSGASLADLTPALARHSATERGLDAGELEQLLTALQNLLAWGAALRGWHNAN